MGLGGRLDCPNLFKALDQHNVTPGVLSASFTSPLLLPSPISNRYFHFPLPPLVSITYIFPPIWCPFLIWVPLLSFPFTSPFSGVLLLSPTSSPLLLDPLVLTLLLGSPRFFCPRSSWAFLVYFLAGICRHFYLLFSFILLAHPLLPTPFPILSVQACASPSSLNLLASILLVSSTFWGVGDLGCKETGFDGWNRAHKRPPSEHCGISRPSEPFPFLSCVPLASASQTQPRLSPDSVCVCFQSCS